MPVCLLAGVFNDEENPGNIKGTLTTNDGQPAAYVTVILGPDGKKVITDETGKFTLRNIRPGNYTLEVSLVGHETVRREVLVESGRTTTLSIILSVSGTQLSEVVVSGSRAKYANTGSEYVAKMPLKNMENPQAYSVVGAELIKEQVITSYDDALKNAPGISKLWSSTGRDGDGAGYYSLRGFAVQPTLVNGLAGLTNGGLDVANVERIEVIKGPSGTLFGGTLISYGGLINTVTKKPYEAFGGEVSYTGGSYGLNRFTLDINTPLDKDKKLLLRVNGAYHDENSFQDAGFRKIRFIAPSLSYKVTDRLSFQLNAEFMSAESTNPTMIFFDRGAPLLAKNLNQLGYDYHRSYTSNNLSIRTPTSTLQAQMIYRLSDQWTSQTVLSRSTAKSQGYYSYLYEVSQYMPGYPNIPGVFGRYISDQNGTTNTTDIQQNLIGDFSIGGLRNRIIAGLDYFSRNSIGNSTGYAADGAITMAGDDTGILTKEHVDSTLQSLPADNSNLLQEVYSAYASDVLNLTPQLSAMASLRVDHFKNGGLTAAADSKYEQTALSPKFGVVYQPVLNRISFFANYMNGFTNSAPRRQNDGSMKTLKPEQADQWEAGIKINTIGSKLTATFSYYDIRVSNIVMEIPGQVGFYMQGGKQYSRGIEADISANPVTGLNLTAGYSYNDSKVTQTDAKDYLDRRPEGAGPKHQANVWAGYKIMEGSIKGFGIGFGGNYGGENMILNRETTGVFTLPAYTVLNGSLFYQSDMVGISLKLDNVTNKIYYKGWSTIEPQMPRRFSANLTFKF
ncbi:MAG TPA: TonB-dependent receptor [Puia sp.]|nr:TonB-dependent receptor [Puia sp.]